MKNSVSSEAVLYVSKLKEILANGLLMNIKIVDPRIYPGLKQRWEQVWKSLINCVCSDKGKITLKNWRREKVGIRISSLIAAYRL